MKRYSPAAYGGMQERSDGRYVEYSETVETWVGLTPKGEKMPQTIEEWQYLAGLYEKGMLEDKEEISRLKQRINKLEQRHTPDGWTAVEDSLPAIGQKVILFGNGVVQEEIFELDAGDSELDLVYFWARDDLEEGVLVKSGQMWMPLPPAPESKE